MWCFMPKPGTSRQNSTLGIFPHQKEKQSFPVTPNWGLKYFNILCLRYHITLLLRLMFWLSSLLMPLILRKFLILAWGVTYKKKLLFLFCSLPPHVLLLIIQQSKWLTCICTLGNFIKLLSRKFFLANFLAMEKISGHQLQ